MSRSPNLYVDLISLYFYFVRFSTHPIYFIILNFFYALFLKITCPRCSSRQTHILYILTTLYITLFFPVYYYISITIYSLSNKAFSVPVLLLGLSPILFSICFTPFNLWYFLIPSSFTVNLFPICFYLLKLPVLAAAPDTHNPFHSHNYPYYINSLFLFPNTSIITCFPNIPVSTNFI